MAALALDGFRVSGDASRDWRDPVKSCVTFVAMAGLMLGVCAPLQGEDRPSRPPAPKTVAEALKQLNVPVVHGDYLNEPIGPK
jgi:hypothetical protein